MSAINLITGQRVNCLAVKQNTDTISNIAIQSLTIVGVERNITNASEDIHIASHTFQF